MKFIILGCGSSMGVPRPDGFFGNCNPNNKKNYRSRCSALIQTKDENILINQEPKEEVDNFINSLNNQQLEKITSFVQTMPSLKHSQEYECKKCGHKNNTELAGLQDFF